MRELIGRLIGARRRSFKEALRGEADLNTAQAVIVVAADGSLTLLVGAALDRELLAESLVALAFDQQTRAGAVGLPSQRPEHAHD